jgi:hypothetical protein
MVLTGRIGELVDWLVDWLNWSIGALLELVDWSNWWIGRMVGLVDWSNGELVDCLIGELVD